MLVLLSQHKLVNTKYAIVLKKQKNVNKGSEMEIILTFTIICFGWHSNKCIEVTKYRLSGHLNPLSTNSIKQSNTFKSSAVADELIECV